MFLIKIIIYIALLGTSTLIGIMLSGKYTNRVTELKEFKNALNIFKTKIKFTYEPIPDVFKEMGELLKNNVGNIFKISSEYMQKETATYAWEKALTENKNLNLTKEDIKILLNLSKLLGKTDIEGQISEIELVDTFLNTQIEEAQKEKQKNEKLYKTLGITIGCAIVIIFL